jgi:hypothetical protein
MNQILLTILLSVLGTLVVGYFIWSIVRLREVMTETKANRKDVNYLNDSLGKAESQIQNDIRKFHEEAILHTDSNMNEIRSDMDRRFDKLYQKIYSECPSMKGE